MSERDIYLNENASAFEECRELHAAIARALAGEADAVTKAAQAFTELSRVESERDRLMIHREALMEFAEWLTSMDDPEDMLGRSERQSVTLTKIIDRAREATPSES